MKTHRRQDMKDKKILALLLALGMISVSVLSAGQVIRTKAEELDAADQSFLEFVLSDTNYEGEIEYAHSPLYNEKLEVNGRQYDFTIGDVEGYALLTEIQGLNKTFYEIEELFYNEQSPFEGCEGLPVYITHGVYLDYRDNVFYDAIDDSLISQEHVEEYAYNGFGYYGGGAFVEQEQTVSYTSKSTQSYSIPFDLPNYRGSVEGMTGCANTAGAILIGYYDRFYESLIPNYKAYVQVGSVVRYKVGTAEVIDLVEELYVLMGTNVNHLGTTFEEFQDGMRQYVSGKGYTYTTTNMFTNGTFNLASYKNSVENGKPVALFLTGYAMLHSITETSTMDTITSGYSANSHVVVGCGYKIDTYYNTSGATIATRNYLKVASGLDTYDIGYLNINALGQIDKAISVQIS